MRNCNVYLTTDPYPIHIVGYIRHERSFKWLTVYGAFRTYFIPVKDIRYISIDIAEVCDGKETT